jgi:exodeoxyribonuclease V beta subunit
MTVIAFPGGRAEGGDGAEGALSELDLTGPLPTGLTVFEASAGTGKTFSLAGLATRVVAEAGVEASQLCVVSFTEAATAELRGRIRVAFGTALHHLEAQTDPGDPAIAGDPVVAHLVADTEARAGRAARLAAALADFDAATISTIHGFCSRVVAARGSAGVELPISADDADVDELVADRYLARYGSVGEWPAAPDKVAEAVKLRLRMPDAEMFHLGRSNRPPLKPDQVARADDLAEIAGLVDDLVDEVRRRRGEGRRRTFDGLLVEARDLLTGPSGDSIRDVLQQRFRMVMVDEFQDTDRVQWDIFRSAFRVGARPVPVVVVGDPKQSIYRFRSAELSSYLDARGEAESVLGLGTNYRSDAALLHGIDRLFAGYEFGDENVRFQPVRAARPDDDPRLVDPSPHAAPVQLRSIDPEVTDTGSVTAAARDDLVAEVVRLLSEVDLRDPSSATGTRRLRASDIGVLVRSNVDATSFVAALAAAGVPAASSSNDSVLDSAAAAQWRILLAALERPSSLPRARAAALTWFVGHSPAQLDALDDDGVADLVDRLRRWALRLVDGGLVALMAEARAGGLLQRVLSRPGGERDLTDLDHVQELLVGAVGGRPVAPSALLAVFDDLASPDDIRPDEALAPELLSRRIDRDDDTVKVLTVHRAKGLEFPVVLCPTLWRRRANRQGIAHAMTDGGRRIDTNQIRLVDKGKGGQLFEAVAKADVVERAGEDSRLLYVALTRARHRLVVWWSPCSMPKATSKAPLPPLGQLLAHASGSEREPDLTGLAASSEGAIAVVDVPARPARASLAATGAAPDLHVATFTRVLDSSWYRWSFSTISARAAEADGADVADGAVEPARGHGAPGGRLDAPAMGGVDEPDATEVAGDVGVGVPRGGSGSAPSVPTPLQAAPAGTAFGTLVHAVLEQVDFAAPDLGRQLCEHSTEQLRYRALPVEPQPLADALEVALRAPLGGPMGARALVDLDRRDRLDELSFDLPLARLDARAIAAVVARHLPVDDLLRPWFVAAEARGVPVPVAGLLTGSIDLVARTADGGVWLADYKTNLLPDGDYGPDALADAMAHHGYPLQATLYLVALHRYLRWRQRDYDPDRHLLGAAYLFLRGMGAGAGAGDLAGVGASVGAGAVVGDGEAEPAGGRAVPLGGERSGVVWWRPPTAAIEELDRLLAVGEAS